MGTRSLRRFKLDAVLELLAGHKSVAQICRERQITDTLLYNWKRTFLERAPGVFESGSTCMTEIQSHVAQLERLVGQLTLENEILKRVSAPASLPWSRNGR
jgi:transposase-like protein